MLALIYPVESMTDRRGNQSFQVTKGSIPKPIRVVQSADRSARAEVPGQMDIDVVTLITGSNLKGVNLFSRVFWNDDWWDLVAPPARRYGTRFTKHWTLTCRRRPDDGGIES